MRDFREWASDFIYRKTRPAWVSNSLGRNYAPISQTPESPFDWDEYHPRPTWHEEFADLLDQQITPPGKPSKKESIKTDLIRHIQGKEGGRDIEKNLIKLYAVMTGQVTLPGQLLDPETLQGTAMELAEGLPRCGGGMLERIKTSWDRLETPISLASLLSTYRREIIETVARNNFKVDRVGESMETHYVNYYLSISNSEMEANISGVEETRYADDYAELRDAVKKDIREALIDKYTPLGIMRYIESQISTMPLIPPEAPALNLQIYDNKTREYEAEVHEHNETLKSILTSLLQKLNIEITDELQTQCLLSKAIAIKEKPPESITLFTDINWKEIRRLIYTTLIQLDIVTKEKNDARIELRPSLKNAQLFEYWLLNIAEPVEIVRWLTTASDSDKAALLKLCYASNNRHEALFQAFESQESVLEDIESKALRQQKGIDCCLFINSKFKSVAQAAREEFIKHIIAIRSDVDSSIQGLKAITSKIVRYNIICAYYEQPENFVFDKPKYVAALLQLIDREQWADFLTKARFPAIEQYLALQYLNADEKMEYVKTLQKSFFTSLSPEEMICRLFDRSSGFRIKIFELAPPQYQLALIQHLITRKQLTNIMGDDLPRFFQMMDQETLSTLIKKDDDMITAIIRAWTPKSTRGLTLACQAITKPEDRIAFLTCFSRHDTLSFKELINTDKQLANVLQRFEASAELRKKVDAMFQSGFAGEKTGEIAFTQTSEITLSEQNNLLKALTPQMLGEMFQSNAEFSTQQLKRLLSGAMESRNAKIINEGITLLHELKKIPPWQEILITALMDARGQSQAPPSLIRCLSQASDFVLEILKEIEPLQRVNIIDWLITIDSFKNSQTQSITLPLGKLLSAIKSLSDAPDLQIKLLSTPYHKDYFQALMWDMSPREWIDLFTALPYPARNCVCDILRDNFSGILRQMPSKELTLFLPLLLEDEAVDEVDELGEAVGEVDELEVEPATIMRKFQHDIAGIVTKGTVAITALPENIWPCLIYRDNFEGVVTVLKNIKHNEAAYKKFILSIIMQGDGELDSAYFIALIYEDCTQLKLLLAVLTPEDKPEPTEAELAEAELAEAKLAEAELAKAELAKAALLDSTKKTLINTMTDPYIQRLFDVSDEPCKTLQMILDQMPEDKQEKLIGKIGLENIFSNRRQNDWIEIANLLFTISPVIQNITNTDSFTHNDLLDALENLKPTHVGSLMQSLKYPMFNTMDELVAIFSVTKNSPTKQSMLIQHLTKDDLQKLHSFIQEENATLSNLFAALSPEVVIGRQIMVPNKGYEFITKLNNELVGIPFITQLPPNIRNC